LGTVIGPKQNFEKKQILPPHLENPPSARLQLNFFNFFFRFLLLFSILLSFFYIFGKFWLQKLRKIKNNQKIAKRIKILKKKLFGEFLKNLGP